uniref:Uncharacterized protein AlNc14C128G6853 n=1 Tax=Albugo laibachii Nc14 TaxID=890382 RepID=F0WJY7_9STRA|nr:conserved hypothetical protein [Albugo laibachii Nc14]|eukprot:CCA21589.1 conserved hypothetical protein [Albugo laibachii Nc14]
MHADHEVLLRQIEQSSTKIEWLRSVYADALDALENALQVLIGKTRKRVWNVPEARKDIITQWFRLFLHVSDLRIEIRRGEIRHKTKRDLTQFSCQHKTGRSKASHSGLSIDDVNVLYQKLDRSSKDHRVRARLECLFLQIDLLDRDQIGSLDSRLKECLSVFESCICKYHKIEIVRDDPHDKLTVYGNRNGDDLVEYSVCRTCFGPSNCLCSVFDLQPWKDFKYPDVKASIDEITKAGKNDGVRRDHVPEMSTSVGLNELKRRYGFETLENSAERSTPPALLKTRRGGLDPSSSANHPDQALRFYRLKLQSSESPECKRLQSILSKMQHNTLHIHLSGMILKNMADSINVFLDTVEHFDIRIAGIDVSNTVLDNVTMKCLCRMFKMKAARRYSLSINMRGLTLDSFGDLLCLLKAMSSDTFGQWIKIRELNLSYNTFILTNDTSALKWLQELPQQFPALEELILVSCFPSLFWDIQHQTEEKVFAALLSLRRFSRLKKIDYSSNWVSSAILHIFFTLSELRQLTLDNLKFASRSLMSEEIVQRHGLEKTRKSIPDLESWTL